MTLDEAKAKITPKELARLNWHHSQQVADYVLLQYDLVVGVCLETIQRIEIISSDAHMSLGRIKETDE